MLIFNKKKIEHTNDWESKSTLFHERWQEMVLTKRTCKIHWAKNE